MEQSLVHLAHFAVWVFIIIFILAFIGFVTVIRWIVNLFRKTESAVEGGVQNVENVFHR